MRLDPEHPSNLAVLERLRGTAAGWQPLLQPVAELSGSLPQTGSHPDIIDRLWDLATHLPVDCRALIGGRAALVAPTSGVIFAVPLGTEYALRLPPPEFALARAAGAEVVHTYRTVGVTLDLAAALGPHWVFGRFDLREPEWCLAAFRFAEDS